MECTTCGKTVDHNYTAYDRQNRPFCTDCANEANRKAREARKLALKAAPRCEVPGCGRRGTYDVGYERVLMCGRHKNAVVRAGFGMGLFGAVCPGRDGLIKMAGGGK